MKEVKMGMGRRRVRLPGLLYADDLFLCGELEVDLRGMVGLFFEVFRRRGLKFNAGKSKVMLLNGEEGLECVYVDGICLEQVFPIFLFFCTPWHFYRFLCTPKNEDFEKKKYVVQSVLYSSGYSL